MGNFVRAIGDRELFAPPTLKMLAFVEGVCLTDRESEVLAVLFMGLTTRSLQPSQREIAQTLGFSYWSWVHKIFSSLRDKGVIGWDDGCPRTARIMKPVKLDFEVAA